MKFTLDYSVDQDAEKIEDMKKSGYPIAFYGAGGACIRLLEKLSGISDLYIKYIIDGSSEKQGSYINNIPIIALNSIGNEHINVIITVNSPRYKEEIYQILKADGRFKNVYSLNSFYPFGAEAVAIAKQHETEIYDTYALLADEQSRCVYKNKINYILTKNQKYLTHQDGFSERGGYFPEDIFSFSNEVFLDGGAFHGENTIQLFNICNVQEAYCVEADKQNYYTLFERMREYPNVRVINKALWQKNDTLKFFQSATMGSAISKTGNVEIECIAIDSISTLANLTFIKLDVEGAEVEALNGARQTISKYSPKLAICVYHKMEHHWQIPLLIHSINPMYKIYMREDYPSTEETICFATI